MTLESSSSRKKVMLESPADEKYYAPLSLGWVREVVNRKSTGTVKCDIYYHPPVGKKLRSRVNIERYLHEKKIENLTLDNFSFFHGKLGYGAPFELERTAKEGEYFRKKRTSLESDGFSQKNTKLKVQNEGIVKKTNDNETHAGILSDEVTGATINNEVGEITGYEEFLRAKPNATPLFLSSTSETASSVANVMKLQVPSRTQILNNYSLTSGSFLKESSAAVLHDQLDSRTTVADASTSGEVKSSSNNLEMNKTRDVCLDNECLDFLKKYRKRTDLSIIVNTNSNLSFKSGIKDDSNPSVSATNNGNRVNKESPEHKLPLRLWHESVVPLKPSTSGVNQSGGGSQIKVNQSGGGSQIKVNQSGGGSQIKVRNWSELSDNLEAPFPVIQPNFKYTRPVWTYCPD